MARDDNPVRGITARSFHEHMQRGRQHGLRSEQHALVNIPLHERDGVGDTVREGIIRREGPSHLHGKRARDHHPSTRGATMRTASTIERVA